MVMSFVFEVRKGTEMQDVQGKDADLSWIVKVRVSGAAVSALVGCLCFLPQATLRNCFSSGVFVVVVVVSPPTKENGNILKVQIK